MIFAGYAVVGGDPPNDRKEEAKLNMHSDFENSNLVKQSPGDSLVSRKLQREVDALESIGFGTQAWKVDDAGSELTLPMLDVNWLISQPLLPYFVHLVPTHLLYRSLSEHGLEDSLEVLEYVQGETLVRLLDYDLWQCADQGAGFLSASEDLSPDRFLQWVKLWNEISPEFAAERLLDLEEEVIFGCLSAVCEIVPVGLNRQQEELNDDYWMTPDNKFGLKLKTPDEAAFEVVHGLVHSLYKKDVRLAQQVLAHSAMLIRDEVVEDARRWRQGRLEDQGFLQSDEARHLLLRRTQKSLHNMIQTALSQNNSHESTEKSGASYEALAVASARDEEAISRIHDVVRKLSNEALQSEISAHLPSAKIQQLIGHDSVQQDVLSEEEELVDAFAAKVTDDCKFLLAKLEAHSAKISKLRRGENELLIDQVMTLLAQKQPTQAVEFKSRIARISNGVLAAFGVVQESSGVARVLHALRGAMNIGLERALAQPESLGLGAVVDKDQHDSTEQALHLMRVVGPEVVFQMGWQALQDLVEDAIQSVVASQKFRNVASCKVTLADGDTIELPIVQLLQGGRYLELRRWLQSVLPVEQVSLRHVLLSTVNRLPLFPILLSEEGNVTRGSTEVKPYERLQEVEVTRDFLSSLPRIMDAMSQEG